MIVVYVLGSGATLGLADARGYRCCNKGNVVVRCGDYKPVPRDPPNHKKALKPSRGILKEVRGDAHHRKERRVLLGRPKDTMVQGRVSRAGGCSSKSPDVSQPLPQAPVAVLVKIFLAGAGLVGCGCGTRSQLN